MFMIMYGPFRNSDSRLRSNEERSMCRASGLFTAKGLWTFMELGPPQQKGGKLQGQLGKE